MLKYPPTGNEHLERDSRSCPIRPALPDGVYIFAQDAAGTVFVLSDEQKHQRVTILGGTVPVQYAGDMEIRQNRVHMVTNCSGTFQFNDRAGLLVVADSIRAAGLAIEPGGVRFLRWDATAAIEVLE